MNLPKKKKKHTQLRFIITSSIQPNTNPIQPFEKLPTLLASYSCMASQKSENVNHGEPN